MTGGKHAKMFFSMFSPSIYFLLLFQISKPKSTPDVKTNTNKFPIWKL